MNLTDDEVILLRKCLERVEWLIGSADSPFTDQLPKKVDQDEEAYWILHRKIMGGTQP